MLNFFEHGTHIFDLVVAVKLYATERVTVDRAARLPLIAHKVVNVARNFFEKLVNNNLELFFEEFYYSKAIFVDVLGHVLLVVD